MRHFEQNTPVFELFVEENKVALLLEPWPEDMFWCSYRVEPVSEEADKLLHDEAAWDEFMFTVKTPDGEVPHIPAIPSLYSIEFCRRETDRLVFRSLWPPRPPSESYSNVVNPLRKFLSKIKRFLFFNNILALDALKLMGRYLNRTVDGIFVLRFALLRHHI